MKNISGLLIKMNREQQGLKQEYLSKGICAVSYLSKIEKGLIVPSEEIIRLLFEKLAITYYDDEEFIREGKILFEEIYKFRYLGITPEEDNLAKINDNRDKFLNSPLYLDYQLFVIAENLFELKDIQLLKLKEYMDSEQLFKAYFFTGIVKEDMSMLKEAFQIKHAPEILYGMGNIKWWEGKYYEAIELYLEALNQAYAEGYIKLQMDICLMLGHVYMDFHVATMQKYYDKALLLSRLLNNITMECNIYYHMGIAYTKGNFKKAEENLLKALKLCPVTDQDYLVKIYQKLCFLYFKYGQNDKAQEYYERAAKLSQSDLVNQLLQIMAETEDYIHCKEYISQLAFVYNQSRRSNKFSNTKYYGDFLLKAYKANRKYKEALTVSEYIYSYLSQDI
ncbi:helix-turn-helix domain-containing protein [Anaerocolumna sp. AGMB13025]|uniref:helix-turn-helix domain-containing protein n=1 Tax=Anaerocolumna sp. AGMB13025 TaxID=3039116 RepID=UPI00241BEA69|nr:helix-turn-helix domain-containing protein [Anaerocolumna sp. AGMB13025]WFR55463.1 helix-turn-helix domain-containing protein [Anaerocolumna sp. AGMB13025]